MKVTKVKRCYLLKDGGLKLRFTSFEFCTAFKDDVYLYYNDVLVAIYGNKKKFEEQYRGAKELTTKPSL